MEIKSKEKKISILIYSSALIIIFPIIAACFFIVPVADDFTNIMSMLNRLNNHSTIFGAALQGTADIYMGTSGYYFAIFVNYFCMPMLRFGTWGLRIFCMLTNLFFVLSIFYLIQIVWRYIFKKSGMVVFSIIFIFFVFCLTNLVFYNEAFFWYCVSAAYVVPMSVMTFGIAFFIKAISLNNKKSLIVACACGFLSSGASLNITAMVCIVYFIIALVSFLNQKGKKYGIIGVTATWAGAVINVLAPGNYIRHDKVSSEYSLLDAVANSVKLVASRFENLFFSTVFIIILIILFLLLIKFVDYPKHYKYPVPFLMLIGLVAALIIIAFPVFFGYGSDYFPGRCLYVEDFAIYLAAFAFVFYITGWIKQKFPEITVDKNQLLPIIIALTIGSCLFIAKSGVLNYPSVTLTRQLLNGQLSMFERYWDGIFDEIENTSNQDVIIVREPLEEETQLISVGLTNDAEHWINRAVAKYYGKKSVKLTLDGGE